MRVRVEKGLKDEGKGSGSSSRVANRIQGVPQMGPELYLEVRC